MKTLCINSLWIQHDDLKSWVPQGACGFDPRPRHWPQLIDTDYRQAVRLCAQAERFVVCRDGDLDARHLLPEKSGRKMDRIECSELGRHRLRGSVQNRRSELHHLDRSD